MNCAGMADHVDGRSPLATLAEHPVESGRVATGRYTAVDVTRGIAVLGMMAVHVFGTFNRDGSATVASIIAAGRSATTFAFVAGISLAFLSGGRTVLAGRRYGAAAAGVAVRGALIGLIGLLLAYLGAADVILSSYGLIFLLALPLLACRARTVAAVAVAIAFLGPVLLVATAQWGLDYPRSPDDPTVSMFLTHPVAVLTLLLFTGAYPAVIYLAYLCAGLAVGRLDLASRQVAAWLLGGGLCLAVTSRLISRLVLYTGGGLGELTADVSAHRLGRATQRVLWETSQGDTWWYLAVPAPHSHSTVDVLHTLGSAMAVLGLAMLVVRLPTAARLLGPVADVGSMPLTIYSVHLFVLATGLWEGKPWVLFVVMATAALIFAVLWRRAFGSGPAERWVASVSGSARRRVEQTGTAATSAGWENPV